MSFSIWVVDKNWVPSRKSSNKSSGTHCGQAAGSGSLGVGRTRMLALFMHTSRRVGLGFPEALCVAGPH